MTSTHEHTQYGDNRSLENETTSKVQHQENATQVSDDRDESNRGTDRLSISFLTNNSVEFTIVKSAKQDSVKSIKMASQYPEQQNSRDQTEAAKGEESNKQSQVIKPTKKRFVILLMFTILQMVKSFQWICLAGITNVAAKFYQVDNLAINWTTILFMFTFLVLALPASWIMDTIGFRRSVLVGSIGVTVGVCIKCFSCARDGFVLSMIGHLLIGLAEPFFFSSYAQLSSIWFPDHQVAMATAVSLIGEQIGLALGFIIPPLMIGNDPDDFDTIQVGLTRLFQIVALICILNTCSIVIFFDEKPKFAPGIARQKQIHREKIWRKSLCHTASFSKSPVVSDKPMGDSQLAMSSSESSVINRGRRLSRRMSQSFSEQMKLSGKLFTSKHFIMLMFGFGLIEGISYSLHTLLNQMITRPAQAADKLTQVGSVGEATSRTGEQLKVLETNMNQAYDSVSSAELFPRWQSNETNLIVGNTGLILILSGLIGSALCGFFLDRWHKYKLTAASIYLLTLIAMVALTVCLILENELLLYIVSIPLGFALTGYASCAFDYGVEITYPKPELQSSTMLNISAQLFGIPISLLGSIIVDSYGNQALGAYFSVILLLGFGITLMQGGRLKRQEAIQEGALQQP